MGFGSSYGEVQKFQKYAAAGLVAPDVLGEEVIGMALFVADGRQCGPQHPDTRRKMKLSWDGNYIPAIKPGKEINHVVPRKSVSALNVTELSKIDKVDYLVKRYHVSIYW
jgi:hypothetical protein